MAHDTNPVDAECIEEPEHVGRMVVRTEKAHWLVAIAETAEIRRDEGVAIGEALHQGFPGEPEFWPTMEENKHRTAAGTRYMKRCPVGLDGQMLHGLSPLRSGRVSRDNVFAFHLQPGVEQFTERLESSAAD
jgi:hypothetical protein